ncbi:winged helix-turn-helix domain-containing protein [Micromonospora sp. NPDC049366]|uniref:winged helix-turn-helix domain-containing protein n=1 Tax=Micromonospora sp. NPDC049366 TaxID=3364271 RepID=UPI0037B6BEF2
MAEHDASGEPGGPGPADGRFPLVIAVTPSASERIRLAEHLDGIGPLLLVSDLDELRRLIGPAQRPPDAAAPEPPADPPPTGGPGPVDDTLLIDSSRLTARHGQREVDLTRLEHDLLICLTSEPLRVWSYAELHRSVWQAEGRQRRADVQSLVKRLRRKLADLGTAVSIAAVRGVGLRLTDNHRSPPGDT